MATAVEVDGTSGTVRAVMTSRKPCLFLLIGRFWCLMAVTSVRGTLDSLNELEGPDPATPNESRLPRAGCSKDVPRRFGVPE